MRLLVAVNNILPTLGEHPVSALSNKHPTVSIILPKIDLAIQDVLLKGWWFNTHDVALLPDSEGAIATPENLLSFNPYCVDAVVRDGQLMNRATQSYVWPVGVAVEGELIERLGFEQLPESVASYVLYTALVTAYFADVGLDNVVQEWKSIRDRALGSVEAEHFRFQKYTTRKSRRYGRLRAAMRG